MNPAFTPSGLKIRTFDEIYQELVTRFKAVYGNDINVDYNTPDGQRLSLLAQIVLDMETFCLNLYNQMDADFASADWLNKLIKYAGIYRRPPSRSQVDVVVETDRDLILPAGYTLRDTLDQLWVIDAPVSVSTGDTTVTFSSKLFGDYSTAPNTVTAFDTIVIGVLTVTNPSASIIGRDEESDEDLRIRRSNSLENPAFSTVGSLASKLLNLPSVIDVMVYENDTETTDVDRDMTPKSIWAIVEGGNVNEITETIIKQKTGGCFLKGDVTNDYNELIVRPDGSTFNIIHEVRFDRPVLQTLKIRLDAKRTDAALPVDVAAMKNHLLTFKTRIGQPIKASEFYSFAYRTGTNFILSALEISKNGGSTWTDEQLTPDYDGRFNFVAADITITEII